MLMDGSRKKMDGDGIGCSKVDCPSTPKSTAVPGSALMSVWGRAGEGETEPARAAVPGSVPG